MTTQAYPDEHSTGASLFADLAGPSEAEQARAQSRASRREQGAPRVQQPNRAQIELRASDLESLLGEDHRARLVWGYVERQNLGALFDAIKARGAAPGRRAIDPRILFALWLYATLDAVGSGREVARLTREHDAYRWICGGVAVNYHALNDFQAGNDALMDGVLSDNVAALAAAGAITLERVAQDGMRVRADAGAASFRRQARLEEHQAEARELVQTLKTQAQAEPGAASRRAQAARLRAAQDREQRIADALARLPEMAATKRRNGDKPEDARTSTTDADASNMKMGDGGWRPAYNVQFATDCASQVIVGVDTVTAGSDMAQLAPMVEQVEQRLGIPATIVMPRFAPAVKVERTRGFGAEVVLEGDTFDDARRHGLRLAQQRGLTLVHPYDDLAVIAGQGTIALEMLQQQPQIDTLMVAIGGGGLIAGVAIAARALRPGIEVIGVQTERFPAAWNAKHGGQRENAQATIADGIAVASPGALPLPLIRRHVDDVLLVGEDDIEQAILMLLEIEKTVVEGAGAVGLAALLKHGERFRGRRVGLILGGGNIEPLVLAEIIERGMVRSGRLARLRFDVRDVPGALADVATLLGRLGANIDEVQHQRAFTSLSVERVQIEVVVQARGVAHIEQILSAMRAEGYRAERVG